MLYWFGFKKQDKTLSFISDSKPKIDSGIIFLKEIDVDDVEIKKLKTTPGIYFSDGNLVIPPKEDKLDIETLLLKLKDGTISKKETEQILTFLLSKHLEQGRI